MYIPMYIVSSFIITYLFSNASIAEAGPCDADRSADSQSCRHASFVGRHLPGDQPDGKNEHEGADQVGELADIIGICPNCEQFDQDFDNFYAETGDRTHREQRDHGGDVTEVDLVKDRHQRHGELQRHKDAGDSGKHCGSDHFSDRPFHCFPPPSHLEKYG